MTLIDIASKRGSKKGKNTTTESCDNWSVGAFIIQAAHEATEHWRSKYKWTNGDKSDSLAGRKKSLQKDQPNV
jgi:hypothetical protein